uniref:NOB1_Zn_bind domain-containing protein n=1 Tax=Mesocestoides corti TaxID=53468 RepID=A0A5K3FNJ4_MESCO
MNEIEQELEHVQEEPLGGQIGVSLDDGEFNANEFGFGCDSDADSSSDGGFASEKSEKSEEIDENEWITADNFDEKLQEGLGLGALRLNEEEDIADDASPVPVACLTKDFAMQNVMMHAGFTLLALSGKIIKCARTHVLWCGSCYAHTTKQNSYFCAICGYPNLRRIPVTLHEDGQLEFHFSRKFKKNLRGTKFPVSRLKGGKHSDNPIYRADQRLPDRRAPKPKNPNVLPMGATNGLLYCDDDGDDFLLDEAAFP